MKKRKITVSFEIEDEKVSESLWDSHKNNTTWNGLKIRTIREGSLNEIIQDELDEEREVNMDPTRGY